MLLYRAGIAAPAQSRAAWDNPSLPVIIRCDEVGTVVLISVALPQDQVAVKTAQPAIPLLLRLRSPTASRAVQ